MVALRKILCPVDFSETSRHAFQYAVLLAQKCAAELTVLHVVEDVPLFTAYAGVPETAIRDEVEKSARKELAELVGSIDPGSGQIRTQLVRGTSYKAIVRYAEEHKADLIVMGTHGRSGLEYAFFGSVTERVMRRAPCPVLIARQAAGKARAQSRSN